jgi:hypothetical protein
MAPKKTRKRQPKKNIKALDPKNAYDFYTLFHPIVEKFKTSHPDNYFSLAKYKGFDYIANNQFLNKMEFTITKSKIEIYKSFPLQTDEKWEKTPEKLVENSRFKKLYKSLKDDDLTTLATKNFLVTLAHIENIRKLFDLFKAPKSFKLPTLYRGITLDKFQDDPFESKKVGETVTINQFMSSSLSSATALKFQSCSSKGPCCLMRLTVDSDVKFLPVFYVYSENYSSSEHEVLIEPFAEYKLIAKKTERIPFDVGLKCPYNDFNKEGKITVTVYDVQVSKPKKESIKKYEELLDKIEKDAKTAVRNVEIKLMFSGLD